MADASLRQDAVWARQLIELLRRRGYPAGEILRSVGIEPRRLMRDGARITIADYVAIFERAAEMTGDPCLGLNFGRDRDVRDAGLIAYVGISSATLGDAIHNIARYRRVFSDASEIETGALTDEGRIEWWFRGAGAPAGRQYLEFSASNILHGFRKIAGRNLAPVSVSFAHPRNSHIERFERVLGCPVAFGRPANSMQFEPADLALPLKGSDDRLLAILRAHCEDVLSRHNAPPPGLIERVERLIAGRLSGGEARLEPVARELGMSGRTLARRLAEHGMSFHEIVDELRRNLALAYLRGGDLSMTQIAFLLGYAEVSSFNHAFRRWTGKAPGELRAGAA